MDGEQSYTFQSFAFADYFKDIPTSLDLILLIMIMWYDTKLQSSNSTCAET